MDSYFLVAESCDVGKRLDVFISESLDNISRSRIKNLCLEGAVTVNGKPQKAGYSVREGEKIAFELAAVAELDVTPEDINVNLVYEDEYLAVVDKEQGMVVHPAAGNESGTLVNALLFKLKNLSGINGVARPGIVHRLDKNTSGLLVIAKTDEAHRKLAEAIAERKVKRCYIGLTDGNIKEDSGVIDAPIARCPKDRKKMAVVYDGRKAVTEFTVLERFGKYTLAEFRLQTGRTHQIRVHAKYINHPIAGDEIYGGSNEFKQKGQLLHAYKLSFDHPVTGERLEFKSQLPPHFQKVLERLGSIYKI